MYNVTLSILSILHQLGRLNKDKSDNEIDDSNTAITGVQIWCRIGKQTDLNNVPFWLPQSPHLDFSE